MNDLYFARYTVDYLKKEFKDNTQYPSEDNSVKPLFDDAAWDTIFQPIREIVDTACSSVLQYIGMYL
jgi:hypothetical protein